MMEQFKSIQGYEGLYEISNHGNVRSIGRTSIKGISTYIKPKNIKFRTNGRYTTVSLSQYGNIKDVYVHRLVAIHFIPNTNKKHFVNHKNGNKKNNLVNNLEWCTNCENMQHAFQNRLAVPHNSKLNEIQVKQIIFLLDKSELTVNEIASQFEVNKSVIGKIYRTETWKHIKRPQTKEYNKRRRKFNL